MDTRYFIIGGVAFLILLMIVFAMMNRDSSEDESPSEISDVKLSAEKI